MTLQINLDKACTVCLQENSNWTSILDDANDGITIQQKIVKCFPSYAQVKFEYPDKICCTCLEDLNAAYRFHNNCEQTSSLLLRCTVLDTTQYQQVNESEYLESTDHEQNVNKSDSSNEECNQFQCEESSELEQIDYDCIEDDIIIEEITDTNIIEACVKSPIKDQVIKRFKSKISKDNQVHNSFINKATKNQQSQKNAPKICELCGNSYKYQHALVAHMRRHLNDRPFKCEFCEKKFVSNVELRRHMRVHTGQKPYTCSYCERSFSDFGSRIKHERTHTGERPFVCTTCNKNFAYAHVLTVHLRTHTGEKKFRCTDCGRGFTKKAYLAAHMQQHTQYADIAAKDKEIYSTLNIQQDTLEVPNEFVDKCDVTLKSSKYGTGFSKKSAMMLQVQQSNIGNTATTDLKSMNNLDVSLGDCITTYIVEADNENHKKQLEHLKQEKDPM